MSTWLLLVHDKVPASEVAAALRAAAPPPWGHIIVMAVLRRWRPLASGVPVAYRGERARALRFIWAQQEITAEQQLKELEEALRPHASSVEVVVAWGDAATEASRWARQVGAEMIVYCLRRRAGLLWAWPGSIPWRLARHSPCPVLLVPLTVSPKEATEGCSLHPSLGDQPTAVRPSLGG